MRRIAFLFTCCLVFLSSSSCTGNAASTQVPPLRVQFTFSAQPWLEELDECRGESILNTELRAVDYFDLGKADMAIRIGDENLDSQAYQIGTEEVLIVVHPENPVSALTAEQVIGLFTGSITNWQTITGNDAPVIVWVFSAGEDIQQVFDHATLNGSPITSLARLAPGPEVMSQAIAEDVNSVGILTRRWLKENLSEVYLVGEVPVLAILPDEPVELVESLVACLQK